MPCLPLRTVPLDEHDTSYFADSARMRSFSIVFSVSMDAKIHKVMGKTKENIVFFAEFPKIIRIFADIMLLRKTKQLNRHETEISILCQ